MARIVLASALAHRLPESDPADDRELVVDAGAATVGDALEAVFAAHPLLRGYVLDERGAPRRHVALFVDGDALQPKTDLARPLRPDAELYVMQALSGG